MKIGGDIKLALLAGACERKKRNGWEYMLPPVAGTAGEKVLFGCVLCFITVYYTLEAQRYGKWVSCYFWPVASGNKVAVSWSWNKSKQEVLPVAEARNLWRNLQRKGWKVENSVVEF